ncbi:hypothetical protein AB1Y20_013789 [Prymnesium parvum]|uniref:Calmodulin n=1 Tax=Prymnesium parvum TaxID=97485 RepID=A0AB34IGI7_PRYPA
MAASIYDLDEAVIEKYDSYFALLDTSNRGILDYVQCTPLFEKANLPAPTLASVVALADSDGDWRLDKKDFRIAMHLLYLAVQGHPVPTSVPAALAASARGADVGAPVDAEPSFGHSSFAGNFSQQPAAMPAPPAAEAPSSSWAAGWNAPPQDASWSSGGQRPPVGPTSLPPAGPGSSEVGAPLDGEPSFGFSSFEEGNFTSELAAMPSAPWKEATNSNWAAASTAPAQDSWSIGGQRPPGGEPLPSHAEGFHQSQRRNSRNSELAVMPLPSHAEGFHQSQRRNSRNSELAVMPSAPRKEAPNSNWAAASNAPAQDSWSIGGQRPPGGEPLPRRTDAEGFHQFQRRNSRNSGLSVQPVPESGSVSTSRPAQPGAWAPGFEMDVPLDGETSFGFSSFESNFPEQSARMPAARSMEAPSSSCAATSNAAPQDAWSNGGQRFGGEAPLSQRAHAEGIPQMEMVNSKSIFLSKQSIPGASLPGEAAIDLLSRSGLPLQDLDHIKRLADWDKDGSLSLDEFCIAMHLVARRKLGEPLINEERNV